MRQQFLLIEDVEDIGRSGEVITAKPGFARNFLLPGQKAVLANEHTLRMQSKLQEERQKKAAIDRKDAEELGAKLNGKVLKITVKVDPEGHMYGSVGTTDIIELFEKEGLKFDKKNVGLNKPIKQVGIHTLTLKLKEGVVCDYTLEIIGEAAQQH